MSNDKKFNMVENHLKNGFKHYGRFLGRHAFKILIVSVLVSALLAVGMLTLHGESDVEEIYTPQNSQAHQDRDRIEQLFTTNTTNNFVEYQLTRSPLGINVIFSDPEQFQKLESFLIIRNVTEIIKNVTINKDGTQMKYKSICGKSSGSCLVIGEFAATTDFRDAYMNQSLEYPIHTDTSGQSHNIQRFLGDVNITGGVVSKIGAIRMFFHVAQDNESQINVAKQWEDEVLERLKDLPYKEDNIAYQSSQSTNQEVDSNTSGDLFLIFLTFTVMITYACTTTSLLYCNMAMGVLATIGIAGVGLAIVAAFGMVSACGLAFVNIVGVVPFLAVGKGIDDMFILLAYFNLKITEVNTYQKMTVAARDNTIQRNHNVEDNCEAKTNKAFDNNINGSDENNVNSHEKPRGDNNHIDLTASQGEPIEATTIEMEVNHQHELPTDENNVNSHEKPRGDNNHIDLEASKKEPIKATTNETQVNQQHKVPTDSGRRMSEAIVEELMGDMYKHAGVSITVTTLTDVLAFGISASSNYVSVRTFCIYTATTLLCCYINTITIFGACLALYSRWFGNVNCSPYRCCKTEKKREENEEIGTPNKSLFVKIFIDTKLRFVILIFFIVYLGLAIWTSTQMEEGLELTNLFSDSSYWKNYVKSNTKYFSDRGPVIQIVIDGPINYWEPSVENSIKNIVSDTQASDYILNDFNITWVESYRSVLNPDGHNISKTDYIKRLKNNFLSIAPQFRNDIVFNQAQNEIIASRVYVQGTGSQENTHQVQMMLDARKAVSKSSLPALAFSTPFVFFEQYITILSTTLQTCGIAVAAMFLVGLIFIPHPLSSILVTITMLMILVGMTALMHVWGLTLSPVTMIQIVLSIGFSVDFSSHVCHVFVADTDWNNSREDRAGATLNKIGFPVLNSAISSILGVILLAASKNYIFRSFFQTMFLVIALGLIHALLFLPVLLSCVGSPLRTCGNGGNIYISPRAGKDSRT